MAGNRKPPEWLQRAGEMGYNAFHDVGQPLYDMATSGRPPMWLQNAGEAAYQGMNRMFQGPAQPQMPMADQIRMQMAQAKMGKGRKRRQMNAFAQNGYDKENGT